jgi:hypothetical protein
MNNSKTCIRITDLPTTAPDQVLRVEIYYSKGHGYVLLCYVVTTNRHGVREYESTILTHSARVVVEEAKRFSAKQLSTLAAELCLDDYHHVLGRALDKAGVTLANPYLSGISDKVLAEFERAEV